MTIPRYLLAIFLILGTALGVLAFGNPQWKYCYMFQVYVWPAEPRDVFNFRESGGIHHNVMTHNNDSFRGVWRGWYPSGQLLFEYSFDGTGTTKPIRAFHKNGVQRFQFDWMEDSDGPNAWDSYWIRIDDKGNIEKMWLFAGGGSTYEMTDPKEISNYIKDHKIVLK